MVDKRKIIFDSLTGFVVNYLEILMKPQKSGYITKWLKIPVFICQPKNYLVVYQSSLNFYLINFSCLLLIQVLIFLILEHNHMDY